MTNQITQFKTLGDSFKLSITDRSLGMMGEYSDDFETLKKVVQDFNFMVKMTGVDNDNRYKFVINIINKTTTKQHAFDYTCSLYDSFYLDTNAYNYNDYDYKYKVDQVKKYKLSKNTIDMDKYEVRKGQLDFINSFLYSVLCCLKSDYYCSSNYFIDIDDFMDNLMPDSKISEVLKVWNDINIQAKKMNSLFTEKQIESFPSYRKKRGIKMRIQEIEIYTFVRFSIIYDKYR